MGSYLHNDGIGELAVRKFIDDECLLRSRLNTILLDDALGRRGENGLSGGTPVPNCVPEETTRDF